MFAAAQSGLLSDFSDKTSQIKLFSAFSLPEQLGKSMGGGKGWMRS